ncbi:hypothetical protein RZR97_05575 [Hydrogenimonas thermophila]|uniref:hypothetical protein n=1 Tax=Hydrogenimonas thermophila TaxID=223786 RepID=UPI002936EC08|nr:hypothetical protein [Hydrogenimonas thermophila]WOE71046.1 hypothetical protein RZR91_05595 [Hydrogenimonas thermophila]WOE73564.1 hypothetical protein RZR97_05575 [Hydrogenimonas thermophila]
MPNIYDKIKDRVEKLSKEKVAKQLGYNSSQHSIKAIDKFLSYDDLYSWLYESGFYDFKYDSKQFLKKICNVVGIDEIEIDKEIQKQIALKKEIDKYKNSYIFVNTNFKRKSEPIFALAFCEPKRRIKINPKEFAYKSDEEIFQMISQMVVKHYNKTNGILPLWGKIVNYVYHHCDSKAYIFDPNGKRIEDAEVRENLAIVTIG